MSVLHIVNNRTEDMVGDLGALTEEERAFAGAQRLTWVAQGWRRRRAALDTR